MTHHRILHVIDHIYPTIGYQETFMAKEHGLANETLVITSDRYTRLIYNANRNLLKTRILRPGLFTEEGIKILRLPVRFEIGFLDNLWLIGLEQAIAKFEPDIIIAHGIVNVTCIRIAILKSKLKKPKIIFDEHMTYNASRGGWIYLFYSLFKLTLTPIFLKSANVLVAVTNETKRFMHDVCGIPFERTIVIPMGIDLDHFYKDSSVRDLVRKKYGIEDKDVVFIYAGKIIPEKGVHLLIDAALQICKSSEKVRFMIVGGNDPSYLTSLKRKISDSNAEDYFLFFDAVPNRELYKYYNAADVGVWPLQCSMTMLEAAACGLPIIISDKSGANERASCGNGLLYSESDPIDLARKITLLLDDKLRKAMSEKAVTYSKTLCWKDISARFLDVLNC